ncbi:DUF2537 domain-containing protein [Rhodococcus sp. ABRD24]|uniref:DUF2537 domain-containing protein n=1 Tax=Rhodococcus sp. ABRD24 TaxID=2507582 RepID=UPI00103EB19F|nr:DUF2537 domain-containing protein [Rhodococcus sp. ABRD24]QBJ97367.1 DUF2537 domain-containing protein [Rhodococcus sp. ABRD24]
MTVGAGPEPAPWSTGLLVSAFAFVVTLVGVVAFGSALAGIHPVLAVGFNVVVVGGAAPTVWRWRRKQVWRWAVYGAAAGVLAGWLALLASAL